MIFTVKYKTIGMTLVAGQVKADSVASAKNEAAGLLYIRHLRSIEYGAIVDEAGTERALLNVGAFNSKKIIEWLTVH